jgi:hypothetical protein
VDDLEGFLLSIRARDIRRRLAIDTRDAMESIVDRRGARHALIMLGGAVASLTRDLDLAKKILALARTAND